MKPRHAAALALVGWYLMLAPQAFDPTGKPLVGIDDRAPLSRWVIVESFENANECQTEVGTLQRAGIKLTKGAPDNAASQVFTKSEQRGKWFVGYADLTAQCIATDDPRLKEK